LGRKIADSRTYDTETNGGSWEHLVLVRDHEPDTGHLREPT
jgi:hypothetical protein